MIETRGLTKRFGNLTAVDSLDLELEKGDIYGFIGPNGAGKTTTMKILATLLSPTSGEAKVCGYSVRGQAAFVRRKIGFMPDTFGVYEELTVSEYLEFFAALYRIGDGRSKICRDVLELTDLGSKAETPVSGLSRGMQQRLGLARLLLHDPEVLLLDEPASGLDPRARIEIRELLRELKAMGKTILISSHILSELHQLCNKVGIIEQGKLLFSGPVQEIIDRTREGRRVDLRVGGDADRAAQILEASPHVKSALSKGNGRFVLDMVLDAPPHDFLAPLLVENEIPLLELQEEEVDLEDAFMRFTEGIVS